MTDDKTDSLRAAMGAVTATEQKENSPQAQGERAVEKVLITTRPPPAPPAKPDPSTRHLLATRTLIQAEGERLTGVVDDIDRRIIEANDERDRKVAALDAERKDALDAFNILRKALTP